MSSNKGSGGSGTKKRKTWRCDVCQIAVFDTYDEALDHEQSCQGNTEADIDALASAVARGVATGAMTNDNDDDEGGEEEDTEREEDDDDEGGPPTGGGGVFASMLPPSGAVNKKKKGINNKKTMNSFIRSNGDGISPTVSTPTVLALLASSRAANNNAASAPPPPIVRVGNSAAAAAGARPQLLSTVAKDWENDDVMEKQQNNRQQQQKQKQKTDNTTTPPASQVQVKPRNKWRCDYCPAVFDEYEVAVTHENECKKGKEKLPLSVLSPPTKNNNKNNLNGGRNQEGAATNGDATINNNKTSSPPPPLPKPWKCDFCPALFADYDEAVEHENQCKLNKGTMDRVPATICIPSKVPAASEKPDTTTDNATTTASTTTPKNNINSNQKRLNWKCDVCLVAVFETYEEAVEHENQCKDDARNIKRAKEQQQQQEQLPKYLKAVQQGKEQQQSNTEGTVVKPRVMVNPYDKLKPKAKTTPSPSMKLANFRKSSLTKKSSSAKKAKASPSPTKKSGSSSKKSPKSPAVNHKPLVGSGEKDVFLSLKDDFYRKHMFAYFRRLGPINPHQRDVDEEKAVKAEAYDFFIDSGCTLLKCHDWKRPDLGHYEVDEEYARRKISDDIRRRLDQVNLWDVEVDDDEESEEDEPAIKTTAIEETKANNTPEVAVERPVEKEAKASKAPTDAAESPVEPPVEKEAKASNAPAVAVEPPVDKPKANEAPSVVVEPQKAPTVAIELPKAHISPAERAKARRTVLSPTVTKPSLTVTKPKENKIPTVEKTKQNKSAAVEQTNKSPAVRNIAVGDKARDLPILHQPIATKVAEKEGQRVEAQQSTLQQSKSKQPQIVHQPTALHQAIAQHPAAKVQNPKPVVQQPTLQQQLQIPKPAVVHELIAQQSQMRQSVAQQQQVYQQIAQQPRQLHQPQTMKSDAQKQQLQQPHVRLPPPEMSQPREVQQDRSKIQHQASNTNENQPPQEITYQDVGAHDYLFGSTVKNHDGNRRFHELALKARATYQSAKPSEKNDIATSVVNEWRSLVPPGRFLTCNKDKGCWTEVGNDKAIAKAKKILRTKPSPNAETSPLASLSSPELTNKTPVDLKRRRTSDVSTTIIASIAQLAEEELQKEIEVPQDTAILADQEQEQAGANEDRKKLQPTLKLTTLIAILLIAGVLSYAPPNIRMKGFEVLLIPGVVVLTIYLVLRLIVAYSSFTLGAATRTPSLRRQVRTLSKNFILPFLASVLIFVSVSLYLQTEGVVMGVLIPRVLALLTLSPVVLFLVFSVTFAMAMVITHETTHHHINQGFFGEAYTLIEDTFRTPQLPTSEPGGKLPTLRDFLSHPDGFHMAFAPAFFGFFAYFGALAALEEGTEGLIVPPIKRKGNDESTGLRSVAGASAGAMAATLLACGIEPSVAADFTSKFTWGMVSDPPGLGGYVKGNRFEEAMVSFLLKEASKSKRVEKSSNTPIQFNEALIPCAVTGFDLFSMKGKILSSGSMAKAARASAGFPGLFQPVAWRENIDENKRLPDSLLIDGGITDALGLVGLCANLSSEQKRVVNLAVGDFGYRGASGLKSLPKELNASSLVSIAIVGTPMCGPWAMENGKRAVDSARKAMELALDTPMEKGDGDNHYVLRVDASKYL